ncbi:sensor histidine kinase [Rhizobium sp. C4]|uniref:sensor histidine kinase n=1 Tax=Rhizobium sp. C4 TaxID=1349800 RepID=UPI001E2E3080|nr:HAMP domain-containing sensor histidine kinase [Rhizobium sp. C4]MCD2174585.1 HAMP domain-containing histidine kinase [Rhizobium sp. C4]
MIARRMKWLSSIRGRFLVLSALTVGLALALTAALLVSLFSNNIRKRIDLELTNQINTLAGALTFDAGGRLVRPSGPLDPRFGIPYGGLYWQVVDDAAAQTMRSVSLFDTELNLPADTHTDGTIHHYLLPGPENRTLIVLERMVRISAPGGQRAIRIAVASNGRALEEARNGFVRDFAPALAALGLFLVGASIAQLAFGLRPLSSLSEGINRIRERRDSRLTGDYPAEFQTTVTAMNQLLDAQGAMIEKARRRAADLAHGLRTPLTVLSNDALTLRDRGETALADELDHLAATMRAHVERELALSRIAARPDLRRGDSDIAKLVGDVIRTVSRTPDGEEITFATEGPAALTAPVDPGDFREIVGNLIENAAKWAKSRVLVAWGADDGRIWFRVADDGPGVPKEELANLTRRGWRLDSAKPGSGLGLSIVREIATVYDMEFELENDAKSGGLCARVTMAAV